MTTALIAGAVVTALSCCTATPSPTPTLAISPTATEAVQTPTVPVATPTGTPIYSATPTLQPTPSPTSTATPAGSPTPSPAVPLALDIQEIPARYTGNYPRAVSSIGDGIIWVGAGSLWRYSPGAAAPERIVKQDPDNMIVSVAGSASGYVYLTEALNTGQQYAINWRLWFLAGPGQTPVLLDQYNRENVPSPEFDIDGEWIVWAAIHGNKVRTAVSVLRAVRVDALGQPHDIVSYPAHDSNIWGPRLNGNEVWYGVNHNGWTNGLAYPRVEMVDLSGASPVPMRYGEDVRAFMPSATDAVVAWKGGGDYRLASGNAGELYIYWRATGALTQVAIPDHSWDRVSYPSVGTRFVAWWDEISTHFFLYDLQTQQVRVAARYDPTGDERIVWPALKGDLLAFVHSPGENLPQQLQWAVLPE